MLVGARCLLVSRSLPSSPDLGGVSKKNMYIHIYIYMPPKTCLSLGPWGADPSRRITCGAMAQPSPLPLALPQVKVEWQSPKLWPSSINTTIAVSISISITVGMPTATIIVMKIKPAQVKGRMALQSRLDAIETLGVSGCRRWTCKV